MTSTTSPTERVGRYQLLDPIGIGPSGTVSRAKVFGVAGFERQFAVKRFHGELTATAAMAAMLSAAARAYGSLEHPRIARMSEFGVAQGSTFTAVEYVLGLDALRLIGEARLAGVTLAAGGALALVSQAARAVGYAHGRGLTHLGLAPTNVIVTAEGDIKITDFGILSATLPQRPIDVPRLTQRIPYLAPEQLANEATSAATDVFALGVLAYELVTGNRTFKGETPQQVASAIMGGPPAEPLLPRPIVRVLQRCLARSPFERFPDARALADALDAALRVAPVPGTRKDIGAQVKETLDRLAALNEGQVSGMVALHLGTGPIRRPDEEDRRPTRNFQEPETPAYELGRADPAGFGPGSTLPDLPRQPMTMPGVPPPPIPVPPGLGPPPSTPPAQASSNTLLGLGRTPPAIPIPRPGSPSGFPVRPPAVPPAALRSSRPSTDLAIPVDPSADLINDSAIHTIDPGDIVSLDSGVFDREMHRVGTAPAVPLITEPLPAEPVAEAPPARVDAADSGSNRARPPEERPSPLFDPILRPDAFAMPAPPADEPVPSPRSWFDTPVPTVEERGAAAAPPDDVGAAASPGVTAPAATAGLAGLDPRLGKTMLGVGAPLLRPTPPPDLPLPPAPGDPPASPAPPVSTDEDEPLESPADQLSGMALEGFRAVPVSPPAAAWPSDAQPDGGSPLPGELAMEPAAALPAMPSGPMLTPPPMSSGPMLTPPPMSSGPIPAGPVMGPADAAPPEMLPPPGPSAMPMQPGWVSTPPPPGLPTVPTVPAVPTVAPGQPRRRMMWILVGMVGAAVVGIGGWQIYKVATKPWEPSAPSIRVSKTPNDARAVPGDAAALAVAPGDAAAVAVAIAADAGSPAPAPDAAVAAATTSELSIASTPPGARVFLDGSDAGVTPLKRPGSPDRHNMAILLAGHELYTAQVDGHGNFQVPLKEVTPTSGPAGIKVLRCKDKDRYYVLVDGKPTGQTCPTERIGCQVGPHTVEVYDVVSETRRKWDIVVTDTRLSYRVKVE